MATAAAVVARSRVSVFAGEREQVRERGSSVRRGALTHAGGGHGAWEQWSAAMAAVKSLWRQEEGGGERMTGGSTRQIFILLPFFPFSY